MQNKATSVKAYLAALPADRREAIRRVREVILEHLPTGYEEGMQYGMIGYYVPHEVYPPGYHCDPKQPVPFASLASQKNHMALYLMCLYGNAEHEARFRKAWQATGKKLDMGKACVRFKRLEDVPLEVIGETVRQVPVEAFIAQIEGQRAAAAARRPARKSGAASTRTKTAKAAATKKTAPSARKKANGTAPKKATKAAAKKKSAKGTAAKKKVSAARKTPSKKSAPSAGRSASGKRRKPKR